MKHFFSMAMALGLTIGAFAQNLVVFQVDLNDYSGSYGQVNLNGGFNGWCGGCAVMTDDDGDNVYQLEIDLAPGTYEYKFTLDGWSQQEMFEDGDACTSTIDGFVNRTIDVTESTTLDVVCYNSCGECDGTGGGGGGGGGGAEGGNITFQVDLSEYTGAYAMVNLNGSFNGWCGTCAEMTDDDGDNIYELTIEAMPAGTIEYKFTLDGWTVAEEFAGGEPCTLTTGEYVNRVYEVAGDATLDAVCWNVCTLCNAEPVPGCTDATACNYNADATEDDGSCVYGEGPNAGFTVMDALCHDGMGSVMLDSATVDIAGATFSVGGMAIENGMMEIAAGTHMLVATGADGCSNETEFTVNAPEELVIEVTLVSQDSGAGDGQASADVSGGTPDYVVVWTNMTGIEVSPDSLASGLYTAIATDANGCTASASLTMTVDGIEDVMSLEGAVFPVPVVDQLNIRLATPLLGDATVDVRDMQGRLVATRAMRTAQQHILIDAASWEAGVYSVQISTEGARASWSFVK